LHFLSLRSMEMYTRICISQAAQLEQLSFLPPSAFAAMKKRLGSAQSLRLASAEMGLAIASLCECIAAGCDGEDCRIQNNDPPKHPPVYENALTLFHASQDLLRCKGQWPDYATNMVERYLSIMYIHFGESDPDVRQISLAVDKMTKQGKRTKRVTSSSKKKKGHRK